MGKYEERLPAKAHQAHLIKGALAASRAAEIKKRGGDDRQQNHDALTEFSRAIGIDPNEPSLLALELAAHQRVRLGDFTGGYDDFGHLAEMAAQKPIVRARALKFQAEIHEFRNGGQPNINAATQLTVPDANVGRGFVNEAEALIEGILAIVKSKDGPG